MSNLCFMLHNLYKEFEPIFLFLLCSNYEGDYVLHEFYLTPHYGNKHWLILFLNQSLSHDA